MQERLQDMLVIFSSRAYGDITMFGDVAKRLLKMMGQSGNIPGAIDSEDLPVALERLKQAVDLEKGAPAEERSDDNENEEEEEPPVTIGQRAFPLIEMLTAAIEADSYVMWYKK